MPQLVAAAEHPAANAVATTLTSAPASAPGNTPDADSGQTDFHPLRRAAVGDWAEYRAADGRHVRYEVTTVGPGEVATLVTVYQNGRMLGEPTSRTDGRDYQPLMLPANKSVKRRVLTEQVQAAGQTWSAVRYEDEWKDEGVAYIRRTWVSSSAPVFGTIRMELRGDGALEASLELTGGSRH